MKDKVILVTGANRGIGLNIIQRLNNELNIYKIGSTYGLPDERAEELTGTGHLYPFKVEFFIEITDAEYYEKLIHRALNKYRVNKNREFFEYFHDTNNY